jgi:hypothetical protein
MLFEEFPLEPTAASALTENDPDPQKVAHRGRWKAYLERGNVRCINTLGKLY